VIIQAGSFVVRTVYYSEGSSIPNCKLFAFRKGLEEQPQSRRYLRASRCISNRQIVGKLKPSNLLIVRLFNGRMTRGLTLVALIPCVVVLAAYSPNLAVQGRKLSKWVKQLNDRDLVL
jgi:hypothetical protein